MAKFIDTNKKYRIELDIAEAHTICEALRQYDKNFLSGLIHYGVRGKQDEVLEEYISELRIKINTVYERYASELNSK